jgi:hypothetical protein
MHFEALSRGDCEQHNPRHSPPYAVGVISSIPESQFYYKFVFLSSLFSSF